MNKKRNIVLSKNSSMLKQLSFIGLIVSSAPLYTMYDPCKDAKKYGISSVVSGAISGMTMHVLNKEVDKIRTKYRYSKCGNGNDAINLLMKRQFPFALSALVMGGLSCTCAIIAAREGYHCYRLIKRQE